VRARRLALLSAGALLAALTATPSPSGRATADPALCGWLLGQPSQVTKVMWIVMENHSYGPGSAQVPGAPGAAYIRGTIDAQCGSAANYHALAHPSYPNYVGATSGSTHGWLLDKLTYFAGPSIFSQVDPSWRSYQEFMPVGCDHTFQTGGPSPPQYYVGRHNPAAAYSDLPVGAPSAGDCPAYDEPLGTTTSGAFVTDIANGTLPSFALVTPGLCDDMHLLPTGVTGCPDPVAGGDAWLATWLPLVTAGPDYQSGHLVVDVMWDEGSSGTNGSDCVTASTRDCIVPDYVISPYTPHVVSATRFSHYSLLRTTEHLLGLPYLGAAGDPSTTDMCGDFGLCAPSTPASPIAYVDSAGVAGFAATVSVTEPATVQPGDVLLLFVTAAYGSVLTAPAGWTLVGSIGTSALTSSIWSRVADATDPGASLSVGFGTAHRGTAQVVAYRGANAAPVAGLASTTLKAAPAAVMTPFATVPGDGTWAVSYWSAKSAAATTWTAPAGQLVRSIANGTSQGHFTSMVTDAGGPAAAGSYGGLFATTDQTSSAGVSWTVVLAPGT
jgi:hypothetical protein